MRFRGSWGSELSLTIRFEFSAEDLSTPVPQADWDVVCHTALRIGQALGMSAEYWLNLQRMYDLDVARASTDTTRIETLIQTTG